MVEKAEEYYLKENYEKSIEYSTRAIEKDSTLSQAYFFRGEAYGFMGKFNFALKDYDKVIQLKPDTNHYLLSLYQRAMTLIILGSRISKICDDLKSVERLIPEHLDFKHLIDDNMMVEICYVIEADTNDVNYNISEISDLGVMLAMKGFLVEAIPVFKEVVYLDPLRDKAHNNIANCYYDLGRKEDALPYLLKTIEINPDNEQALQTLSDYYYNIDLELSLRYARKSAKLGNKSVQQWLENNGYEW